MDDKIEEIQKLIDEENLEKAEQEARALLENNPEDAQYQLLLGRILCIEQKYDEAITVCKAINEKDENNSQSLFYLAISYHNQNKYRLAIDTYNKLLPLAKNKSIVNLYLGRIYNSWEYKGRNEEEAKRHFRAATLGDNPSESAFIELGSLEDLNRRILVIRTGIRHFPHNETLHTELCQAQYFGGNFSECISSVEEARKSGVENDDIHFVSGLAYIKLQNSNLAINELRKIQAEDDASRYAIKVLEGIAQIETSQLNEATNVLKEVISEDYGNLLDFSAHILLAYSYILNNNFKEASNVFNELPLSKVFYPELRVTFNTRYGDFEIDEYLLAVLENMSTKGYSPEVRAKAKVLRANYTQNLLARSNDTKPNPEKIEQVKADLKDGLETFPHDSDLHITYADFLVEMRDWEGAIRHKFLGIAENRTSKVASVYFGDQILESLFDDEELLENFFQLLKEFAKESGSFSIEFAVQCLPEFVRFSMKRREYELIVRICEMFSFQRWKEGEVLFELAYSYVETNQKKQGKDLYKAYLREVGENSSVVNNLAILEEEEGSLYEAERLLNLALELDASNEKAPGNIKRVQVKIKKLEEQKRAVQRASELFAQEPDNSRKTIAELYAGRTTDDLILCDLQKTSQNLGMKLERGKQIISEFIQKRYFEEVKDHELAFNGKVLQLNPVIIPLVEKELEEIRKINFIEEVSEKLSGEYLETQYGYNKELLNSLKVVNLPELSAALARDLNEAIISLVTESYKASLILCGSILEALLLDQLMATEPTAIKTLETILAKDGKGIKSEDKKLEKWALGRMLDVSMEMKLISSNLYHWGHGIREFRNLVHPGLEYRSSIEVSRENAEMAWNVTKRLLKELDERKKKDSSFVPPS